MAEISFDTGLAEDAFAKTKLAAELFEAGVLATSGAISPRMNFSFAEWKFDGVKTEGGTVHLCGTHERNLRSLAEIFDEAERENTQNNNAQNGAQKESENNNGNIAYQAACAAFAVCAALAQAAKQNVRIENVGAGGIFIRLNVGFCKERNEMPENVLSAEPAPRLHGVAFMARSSSLTRQVQRVSEPAYAHFPNASPSMQNSPLTTVEPDGAGIEILFLPPTLFDSVCALKGAAQYAKLQGLWTSKLIPSPQAALAFTKATIAYRALTAHFPFAAEDEMARHADEIDKRFLRLEHAINGVNPALADAVDSALELPVLFAKSDARKNPPAKELPLDALYVELGLGGSEEKLIDVERPNALPETEFRAKVKAYYSSKERALKRRRMFKRNAALIGGIAVAVVIAMLFAISVYNGNSERPTSRGLTSTQVVEAFYKGMHTQNVELVGEMTAGAAKRHYSDIVSGVYVISRARSAYEPQNAIVTPEEWLRLQAGKSDIEMRAIYGITRFTLDGKENALAIDVPQRNAKPHPLAKESGVQLDDGAVAIHKADYYFVHTDGAENDFVVEKCSDTITLVFENKSWKIRELEEDDSDVSVDAAQFKTDAQATLNEADGDIFKMVTLLETVYPWLPSTTAISFATTE